MVRKFKKAIKSVQFFVAILILYIKDVSYRFWFNQTIDDIYYLKSMTTEKVRVKMLEFVNYDLDILRTIEEKSGIKCLEETTKDVIWRYDIIANKIRVIKVK